MRWPAQRCSASNGVGGAWWRGVATGVKVQEVASSDAEEVRHASQNADSVYPFCHHMHYKMSQLFVTHVVPSLAQRCLTSNRVGGAWWRGVATGDT